MSECCICHNDNLLKDLSCGHCICGECAKNYLISKWKMGNNEIHCPLCRKKFNSSCIALQQSIFIILDTFIFKIGTELQVYSGSLKRHWHRKCGRLLRVEPLQMFQPSALYSCSGLKKEF